jgi:SAM-dependent methyltransferase
MQVLQSAAGLWVSARFDRRAGVDTGGQISVDELDVPYEARGGAFGFGSVPVRSLRAALRRLEVGGLDWTFIDLGCGKGRALLIAAEFEFSRLIGVEHSPTLAIVAQKNVEAAQHRFPGRCLEVRHADAASFDRPDAPCVVFFYTPFEVTLLRSVLQRFETAQLRTPRPMILLFARQQVEGGPRIEGAVEEFPNFRPLRRKLDGFDWANHPQIAFAAFEHRASSRMMVRQ